MDRQDFNEQIFKKDFYKLMSGYPNAWELIRTLEKDGELILFGGVIREYIDNKFDNMPRDFDLVFNKKVKDTDLERLLDGFDHRKNRFGGYKLTLDSLEFDIWEIEDTWAFKEKKVRCKKRNYVSGLQKTVFLNIDSIVYSLYREKLYGDNYKKAMEEKTLDIILEENPYIELNFLRAIIFKVKYDMGLSERLAENIAGYIRSTKNYLDELYRIQISHYNYEKVSRSDLNTQLDEILSQCY